MKAAAAVQKNPCSMPWQRRWRFPPASLMVPDLDDPATLLHILFALEDRYDLKLSQSNCATNVQISIPSQSVTHLYCMLFLWQIMRDRLASGKLTREEYDEWRYGVT